MNLLIEVLVFMLDKSHKRVIPSQLADAKKFLLGLVTTELIKLYPERVLRRFPSGKLHKHIVPSPLPETKMHPSELIAREGTESV